MESAELKKAIREIMGEAAAKKVVDEVARLVPILRSESGMDLTSAIKYVVKDLEESQQQGSREHGLGESVTELS